MSSKCSFHTIRLGATSLGTLHCQITFPGKNISLTTSLNLP